MELARLDIQVLISITRQNIPTGHSQGALQPTSRVTNNASTFVARNWAEAGRHVDGCGGTAHITVGPSRRAELTTLPTELYVRQHDYWWSTAGQTTTAPRAFVDELATFALFKPRTEAAFRDLSSFAKMRIKTYDVTTTQSREICETAVPMAFCMSLDREIAAIEDMNNIMHNMPSRLRTAMAVIGVQMSTSTATRVIQLIASMAVMYKVKGNVQRFVAVSVAFIVLYMRWKMTRYVVSVDPNVSVGDEAVNDIPSYCCKASNIKPMRAGSKCTAAPEGECYQTVGLLKIGPSLVRTNLSAPRCCEHNEFVAVRNRALMRVDIPHAPTMISFTTFYE